MVSLTKFDHEEKQSPPPNYQIIRPWALHRALHETRLGLVSYEENFSKTLLLTNLSKFIFFTEINSFP